VENKTAQQVEAPEVHPNEMRSARCVSGTSARVAGFYEREVDGLHAEDLSAAIEPLLIVCVGGMVLVLALGVFLPMWELIAKVGGGGQ
jgi:hypothetical protein